MNIRMKHIVLAVAAMILATTVFAQGQNYCKGLKNPTSFTISSAGNSASAQWYGYTGSKNAQASNCTQWGMSGWGTQIPASQLASQSSGSSCTSSNSTDIGGQSDTQKRFVIKGNGSDPLTGNRLSYLPPDSTFTSSIRLGNNCGGSHEAEMLCYEFNVRPQNALIFIWYALSLQNGQHSVAENPEFAIQIEKQVGNNWVLIGGDTLCYIQPTPAGSSADVTPFYSGSNGTHNVGTGGYGANIYLPWNKVAINLNNYLFETVRIKIGAGDCSMSAHYACSYIAGECQPMEIKTSGCPAGEGNVIDTLRAPTGLSNYVWYKSNQGSEGIANLLNVPASVNFTRITPTTSTDNTYLCRLDDFLLTEGTMAGQYTNEQIFRCDMTSYMNPNIPIISKVYVRVRNTKPTIAIDTIKTCDGDVDFISKSFVPNDMLGCNNSLSEWTFYEGGSNSTPIAATAIGDTVSHSWDSAGFYAVSVRSYNGQDISCYTDENYVIHVLGRPKNPTIGIEPAKLVCPGDMVRLSDNTVGSVRRDWIFEDETLIGNAEGSNRSVDKIFTNYKNPIELTAYNGLYALDRIDPNIKIYCTSTAYDTVTVFKNPELTITGDTVVCNGQTTDITVTTSTPNCNYNWYRDTTGTSLISEGQTLHTMPYADTCTYYVKVSETTAGCIAWDSVNAYRVNPKLSISRHDMCEGDIVTLNAEGAYSYSWTASPADSTLDAYIDSLGHGPSEISVSPKTTTVYTLVGHGTNDCSASPLTEQITIHPVPVAMVEYTPDFVDSDNPMVTFTDASPYSVRRVWYFEDGIGEEYTSPCTHNFGEVSSDSVNVRMIAYNDLDCSDEIAFRLDVTQFTFFAPNVFTPERPDNNVFRIFTANRQENFSVHIYDRNGRQVYTSNELDFAWDGTSEGIKCPQGSYAYVIRYRRPGTEDIVTQKGVVTLLR